MTIYQTVPLVVYCPILLITFRYFTCTCNKPCKFHVLAVIVKCDHFMPNTYVRRLSRKCA